MNALIKKVYFNGKYFGKKEIAKSDGSILPPVHSF